MKKTKKDVALIVILLALAGVCFFLFSAVGKREGAVALVSVDGEEIGRYVLAEEREIEIEGLGGKNRIEIRDGAVRMEWADCPDQYCVRHGSISRSGDPIVCLPHRVIVTVEE